MLKDRTNTIPFKVLKKNSNYTRMKNEDNLFHSSLVQLTDSIQNLSITPTTNEILFQKKIEQLTNLFESTRASPTQFEKGSENIEWIAKINSLLQEKGFDFAKLNADEKRAMKEYGTQLHTLEALDMWITEHTITKLQENFPNLRSLTFTACRISEGVQAKLNKFPDLAQLIFKGCDSRDQLVSRTTK
ncbi:MAG: hypothetical protein JWO53_1145 [Chlamydiia bacterium]|nr:hypothetical protein [Chlamydiia bacterium]